MILSIAIIIILWLDMDVTGFTILGIAPGYKLDEGTIAILIFLSISLFVNWASDVISNGMFSIFSKTKPIEGMNDIAKERSYIKTIKEHVEFVRKSVLELKTHNSDADLIRKFDSINENVTRLLGEMDKLNKSGWWFSLYACFYVIVWHFVVPLAMAAFAIVLLYHA